MLFAIKTTILKKYSITSIITPLLVFGYYGLYTPYTIFSCTVLVNQKINNNLLNGIMLIHPPILYIAYACICVSTYIAIQGITDHYIQQKNFFKNVDRIFLVQSVLLIISVLLGC
jgi:cytochrome c biogenesis factor